MWVTGTYDPATNQTIWGTGNPVPMFDPTYRPGDNLYTNSAISWDPDTGKMNWYFQYTPGDMWDYDEVGTHILIDGQVDGQPRKLITHSARNGFLYTMERANGQIVLAKPYMDNVNWTKGIDQKTGKPLDYDPNKDIQTYAGVANADAERADQEAVPEPSGGNNYWPSSYSPKTKLIYIPALTACARRHASTRRQRSKAGGLDRRRRATPTERYESNLTAVDPLTGESQEERSHLPYPNYSGALATGGGLVFIALHRRHRRGLRRHHARAAVEDQCRLGFNAPPMTFEVERQAIRRDRVRARAASRVAGSSTRRS